MCRDCERRTGFLEPARGRLRVMTLADYGWTEALALAFAPHAAAGLEPARVVCELRRNFYAVQTEDGEVLAECGGGFFHVAKKPDQFPAVGDWVAVKRRAGEPRADLHVVLPRTTKFSRRASGSDPPACCWERSGPYGICLCSSFREPTRRASPSRCTCSR